MKKQDEKSAWYAEGDPWVLAQNEWDADKSFYSETIFSQANGYMGFRGYREETDTAGKSVREGYLAGVFSKLPPLARELVVHDYEWDSRQMVALPELFAAWIVLEGNAYCLTAGELKAYRQSLDMRTGMLTREVVWSDEKGGRETRICFNRFLSAAVPNLAVQKIEVEPLNWSGEAEIFWDYDLTQKTLFRCGDPAKAQVPCPHFIVHDASGKGDTAGGLVETEGSGHRIAFSSRLKGEGAASSATRAGTVSQKGAARVSPGNVYVWERISAVVTSRDEGVRDPAGVARERLNEAAEKGFDKLAEESASVWAARWQDADIEVEGSAHDQVLIRFGIFSLLQVAPFHSDTISVPARCYAYNRYNGLYFWDGEIFLLPFYQFCTPEVAQNMLKFRCGTLEGAKKNAALLNARGALFPWQGDSDFGEEQAPWGLYHHLWHQNADIVYAFDQYARATGDHAFMCNDGLEVLAETARFWLSMLKKGDDSLYHIDGAIGPDEAEKPGPDNGFTCIMARRSLEISSRWWKQSVMKGEEAAVRIADKLGVSEEEYVHWGEVASAISVPEVPGEPGVPLQDAALLERRREDISGMTVDEFWKRRGEVQVIKQADIILAMYLCEDEFTHDQIKRGYEFYEPRTLHVSSLSLNTHAIIAAIVGKSDEAYAYFQRAAGLDLDNFRNATKDGLHAAALGAVWQMVIPGFMGLRVREDHLFLQPALPTAWNRIRFPMYYRGWRLDVSATSDAYEINVSGQGQQGAVIRIGEDEHALTAGKAIIGSYGPSELTVA